jgi:hypothetical protein
MERPLEPIQLRQVFAIRLDRIDATEELELDQVSIGVVRLRPAKQLP